MSKKRKTLNNADRDYIAKSDLTNEELSAELNLDVGVIEGYRKTTQKKDVVLNKMSRSVRPDGKPAGLVMNGAASEIMDTLSENRPKGMSERIKNCTSKVFPEG